MSQQITLDRSLRWQRRALRSRHIPELDPNGLLRRSLNIYDQRRRASWELETLAAFPPVARAIERITTGILNMRWSVLPPIGQEQVQAAVDTARWLGQSLRRPNLQGDGVDGLLSAAVRDLLVHAVSGIERQPGDDTQAFWLWPIDPTKMELVNGWEPGSDLPRYRYHNGSHLVDLQDEQAFLIKRLGSSAELFPRSPVEVAAPAVLAWISLLDYQTIQTSKSNPATLIHLGDVSKDELDEFRDYWEYDVLQLGKQPSMGGKGTPQILRLNSQTDEGLYLKYAESLLKTIAICFNLTPRDLGLTDHDNRATAGEAASSTHADAVAPVARLIFRKLHDEVIDFYFPGYRLELTDTEPRTENEEAERAVLLWDKGVITLNQTLIAVGMEPIGPEGERRINEIPGGEVLSLPRQRKGSSRDQTTRN